MDIREKKRVFNVFTITAILFLVINGWALAQEKFPTRPISIIVCWAPGGVSHMNAQVLQPHLARTLGVGVEIINKAGAGGTIGWNYAANSPPDGYTVAQTNPSIIYTLYTTKTGVHYDKFDQIILTVKVPYSVFVRADAPWKTFKELIDYAKAHPGKVQMGTTGVGTTSDIGTLGIEMAAGVKFMRIPFKGSGPIFTALLGGHVDGTFIELTTGLPFAEGKRARVIAVSHPERSLAVPDVPTFRELGLDLPVNTWQGYAVPKGTPRERIKILHDAFKSAMETEEFKSYYRKQGGIVEYIGLKDVTTFCNDQERMLKKIIEYSGFKPAE